MSKVIADITMSLDGYVAPPSADSQGGVGNVDELQTWVMEQDPVDTEILERATAATGAVVMGRRLFDIVDAPDVWTKDMAYGAQPAGTLPFFVVTHSAPQDVRLERELGMRFTFVDDLAAAVDQARTAAADGHVVIMGGGDVIGQAIEQGLVDELHLHLAPMLLGGGTPLFRAGTRQKYRQRDVRPSSNAVHLIYERADQSCRSRAMGKQRIVARMATGRCGRRSVPQQGGVTEMAGVVVDHSDQHLAQRHRASTAAVLVQGIVAGDVETGASATNRSANVHLCSPCVPRLRNHLRVGNSAIEIAVTVGGGAVQPGHVLSRHRHPERSHARSRPVGVAAPGATSSTARRSAAPSPRHRARSASSPM